MACTTIAFGHPSEPPRFGLHNDDNCTKPPSVEVINFTTSEVVIIMRNESGIIKILMIKSLKKEIIFFMISNIKKLITVLQKKSKIFEA